MDLDWNFCVGKWPSTIHDDAGRAFLKATGST